MEQMELDGFEQLAQHNLLLFFGQYLQTRGLLREDYVQVDEGDVIRYQREEEFWRDVLSGRQIYETCRVSFQSFVLLQWVPRAPGQYHTPDGREARQMARRLVAEQSARHIVFKPSGKASMIRGGIGCMRLASKPVAGEQLHFLCATSSGVAHRGLLIGVPEHLYAKIARPLEQDGGVACHILGQVCYWAPGEPLPFYTPPELRRMYVRAESITPARTELARALDVTAAVTFHGEVEGRLGEYFTYSHFNPRDRADIEHCVRWMEDNYVKGRYGGKVLTDFDEITPHFDDVAFPVRALMDPRTGQDTVLRVLTDNLGLDEHQAGQLRIVMNQIFIGKAQGVVLGDHSKVDITFPSD